MLSCCLIEMGRFEEALPFPGYILDETCRVYPHIQKKKKIVDMYLYVYIKVGL